MFCEPLKCLSYSIEMSDNFSSCKLCHQSWINFQNCPQPTQPIKQFQRAELPTSVHLLLMIISHNFQSFGCLKCPTEYQLMSRKISFQNHQNINQIIPDNMEIYFTENLNPTQLFIKFFYELFCRCLYIAVKIMVNSSRKVRFVCCRTCSVSRSCFC